MKIILDESEVSQESINDIYRFINGITYDPKGSVSNVEVIYDRKVLMNIYWDFDCESDAPGGIIRYRGSNTNLFNELKLISPIK